MSMFDMTISVGELMIRAACVYAYLFVWLRFGGKKHVGEMAPFDMVVLLILSETTQNALVGDDKSLLGGLISAGSLLLIVHGMSYITWRSRRVRRLFEGVPRILVRHGESRQDVLNKEHITSEELLAALRQHGVTSLSKVRVAILETDGKITVIKSDSSADG
jgi:uncharacterized membrane protein YcaP (DUF421 family)